MNFLAELKRRNVFRAAGLYLVGAWLVVQVAEQRPIVSCCFVYRPTLVIGRNATLSRHSQATALRKRHRSMDASTDQEKGRRLTAAIWLIGVG
jgi:hypothetical protein